MDASTLTRVAEAYARTGQTETARRILAQALSKDPEHEPAVELKKRLD